MSIGHYTAVLYLIDSSVLLKHPWCRIMVYLPTSCAGSIVLQATLVHVVLWDVILEVKCSIQEMGKLMLKFCL